MLMSMCCARFLTWKWFGRSGFNRNRNEFWLILIGFFLDSFEIPRITNLLCMLYKRLFNPCNSILLDKKKCILVRIFLNLENFLNIRYILHHIKIMIDLWRHLRQHHGQFYLNEIAGMFSPVWVLRYNFLWIKYYNHVVIIYYSFLVY